MGRDSAGARSRGMGRDNDAKTAISHKRNQVKIIENHGQGQCIARFEGVWAGAVQGQGCRAWAGAVQGQGRGAWSGAMMLKLLL